MIGEVGRVTVASKGEGPAEADFGKKGVWIVWSKTPLAMGAQVMATGQCGSRALDVQPIDL